MTSSMARLRLALSLTVKSPVLASVTAARPICRPVRREVLSTSGCVAEDALDMLENAVGLGERTAGGHDVVEDESALVHLRQQIGAERPVAEVGADHEQQAGDAEPQRLGQRPVEHAAMEFENAAEKAAGRVLVACPSRLAGRAAARGSGRASR